MQECGTGGSISATAAKLKYSICRNLAGIFKDQGDLTVAIDTYLKVSRVMLVHQTQLLSDKIHIIDRPLILMILT